MQNPILAALGPNQQTMGNLSQIKQMMNIVRSAQNPQMMLQTMAQNNPQIRQVMQLVNDNGGDAKKAFYSLAQQKGVNPDDVLNMLK